MKKNGSPELHLRFHILSMTFKKSDKNHQNLGGGVINILRMFLVYRNYSQFLLTDILVYFT